MLKYKDIVNKLTVKQKISLLTDIECLCDPVFNKMGIPKVTTKFLDELLKSETEGVSYPCLSRSWNGDTVRRFTECVLAKGKDDGAELIVTPSPKIKFDNYRAVISEDPCLSGKLAGAYLSAVRNTGGNGCPDEFYLTNEDLEELDVRMNRQVIWEYFIKPFRTAVQGVECNAVVSSDQRLKGSYTQINKELTQHVSSEIFGSGTYALCSTSSFDDTFTILTSGGILIKGLAAALESCYENYLNIKKAVDEQYASVSELEDAYKNGTAISDEMLNAAVDRVIGFAFSCAEKKKSGILHSYSEKDRAQLEDQALCESIVLLKNENIKKKDVLPLSADKKIAIIGDIAMTSGRTGNKSFADSFVSALPNQCVGMARGYDIENATDSIEIAKAEELAKNADAVFVFLGMNEQAVQKAAVLGSMMLPANQIALLAALEKYKAKTIAVLSSDIAVDTSFDDSVQALLLAPICGEASARALAQIISGSVSPSGRLTESFYDSADESVALIQHYKLTKRNKIGPFIGYRYFDSNGISVKYPFGYGLGYSAFEYSSLRISGRTVTFTVTNVGNMRAAEVAQVYVGNAYSARIRPKKELKAFCRVELDPHQKQDVSVELSDLDIYDEVEKRWVKEKGTYSVFVGASVSDIRLTGMCVVTGEVLADINEKLSDYLQSESNILENEYTLEAGSDQMKNIGNKALRKEEAEMKKTKVNELFENAEEVDGEVIESLFAKEFDDSEYTRKKETASNNDKEHNDDYGINESVTFTECSKMLVDFAEKNGISIDFENAVSVIAAFASSRMILTKLPEDIFSVMAKFFGEKLYRENLTAEHLNGGNLLFVKGADGRSNSTAVAAALDNAHRNKNNVQTVFFTGADAEYMEQMFLPYLRYIGNPNGNNQISADNQRVTRVIDSNVWFVVNLAANVKLEQLPTTIVETATWLDIRYSVVGKLGGEVNEAELTYRQLEHLINKNKNKHTISEDLWKKVDEVEAYANAHAPYHMGNKLCLQIERTLAVLLDCGCTGLEALDKALAADLMPVLVSFLNGKVSSDEKSLLELLEQLFGEDKLPSCRRMLTGVTSTNL